jgi:hypothetical protein
MQGAGDIQLRAKAEAALATATAERRTAEAALADAQRRMAEAARVLNAEKMDVSTI